MELEQPVPYVERPMMSALCLVWFQRASPIHSFLGIQVMPKLFEGNYKRRGNAYAGRTSSVGGGDVGGGAGGAAAPGRKSSTGGESFDLDARRGAKEAATLTTCDEDTPGLAKANNLFIRSTNLGGKIEDDSLSGFTSESTTLTKGFRGADSNRTHQLRQQKQQLLLKNELSKTQLELAHTLASLDLAERRAAKLEKELAETRLERDNALACADLAEKRAVQLERDCQATITRHRIQMQSQVDSSREEARAARVELAELHRWKEIRTEQDMIQKDQEIEHVQPSSSQVDKMLQNGNRRLQDSYKSLQDINMSLEHENHRLRDDLNGQKSLAKELKERIHRLKSGSSQTPVGRRAAAGTSLTAAAAPDTPANSVHDRARVRNRPGGKDLENATPSACSSPLLSHQNSRTRESPPALAPSPTSVRARSAAVLPDPLRRPTATSTRSQDNLHDVGAGDGLPSRSTTNSTCSPVDRNIPPSPVVRRRRPKRGMREAEDLKLNNARFANEFYRSRGGRRKSPAKRPSPRKRSSRGDVLGRLEEPLVETCAATSTARTRDGAVGEGEPDLSATPSRCRVMSGDSPPASQPVAASLLATKPAPPPRSATPSRASVSALSLSLRKRQLRSFDNGDHSSYPFSTLSFADTTPCVVSGDRIEASATSVPAGGDHRTPASALSNKKRRLSIESPESEGSGDAT